MLIEIKSWLDGSVLFSHDCENNSIRTTLELGVSLGVSFAYAKLNGAKLNGAKLNYAKLNYAKLNYAELNNAKLNGAKLNYAKLNYAKLNNAELNNAELNNAKLNNAKLNYAIGNGAEIKTLLATRYKIVWTVTMLFIGCTSHSKTEWLSFTDTEIKAMDTGALEWWKEWKPRLIVLGVFD